LYESLYEQYSTLDFSYPADRSVAILGLEQRLTRAFNDHGEHGIFKKHLERGLMWQRGRDGNGQEVKKLIRIKQKVADHDRGRLSPTWSWMAYEGGISFIAPTGGSLEWDERISWLTGDGKGNLRLKGVAREINLPDQNDTKIAEIIWDAGDRPENKTLKCVVFGTTKTKAETDVALKQHYVLMIAKVSAGGETLYERVGAGFLPGSSIKAQEEDVFIV
jgi:hypothetical protein